uniref:Uncharacterized protein n=1 Tax=Acrobeloides nanus TaxID=290746 RepID=A0A914CMS2_9BILA
MSRDNKKEPPSTNFSGFWTDNNTKTSKFSVSGLLKGKSSRKNYLIIVGILFVLALLLGIATIILISKQSQGTTESQETTQSQEPYNPLTDPNCSNCTCYAYIDLALDITTDLTLDAFKLQNEFVDYYISKMYDPQFLANDSQVNINYGVDAFYLAYF